MIPYGDGGAEAVEQPDDGLIDALEYPCEQTRGGRYGRPVERLYHVTSIRNRDSIRRFGLDCSRMGAARGIAGSRKPEVDGVFLADENTAGFFIRINNTGGPVDVWAADGIEPASLITSPEGFEYFPGTIPSDRISLHRQDIPLP